MFYKLCKFFAVAGVLLCSSTQLFAAEKKVVKSNNKPTVEIPFDDSVEKVPLNFRANNPVSIYIALNKNMNKYEKTEFETIDVYNKRMDELTKSSLIDKVFINSTISFVPTLIDETSYDAENGMMTVKIKNEIIFDNNMGLKASKIKSTPIDADNIPKAVKAFGADNGGLSGIEIFKHLQKTKKYTGTNAFGVKLKVTSKTYDIFTIAAMNDGKIIKPYSDISFKIPMDSETAKDAKEFGRLLFIGKLVYPFQGKNFSQTSATIDSPTEIFEYTNYMSMKITGIWYYNGRSGVVYHKEAL